MQLYFPRQPARPRLPLCTTMPLLTIIARVTDGLPLVRPLLPPAPHTPTGQLPDPYAGGFAAQQWQPGPDNDAGTGTQQAGSGRKLRGKRQTHAAPAQARQIIRKLNHHSPLKMAIDAGDYYFWCVCHLLQCPPSLCTALLLPRVAHAAT